VRASGCGTTWRSGRAERGGRCPDRWGIVRAVRHRPGHGSRGLRGVATSRGQPNRRGGKGADGWATATVPGDSTGWQTGLSSTVLAAQIQIGFKNISNGFKFAQTLTDPNGAFHA
jgi:hypothetical protein